MEQELTEMHNGHVVRWKCALPPPKDSTRHVHAYECVKFNKDNRSSWLIIRGSGVRHYTDIGVA